MIDLILFLLVSLGLIFLYFQLKTYKQQKEYIKNERKALKKLRRANLTMLKPKFIYGPPKEAVKN